MVAEINAESITVALGRMEWLDLTSAEALVAQISLFTSHVPTDGGLVNGAVIPFFIANFSWSDATPSRPTGMLVGPSSLVFGGADIGYYAHHARPARVSELSASTRSRRSGSQYMETSFGMGDKLQWNQDSHVRSAVVRVVYEPQVEKTTSSKKLTARKMLVLMELQDDEQLERSQLFVASWCNWSRVPLSASGWKESEHPDAFGSECETVGDANYLILDEVS